MDGDNGGDDKGAAELREYVAFDDAPCFAVGEFFQAVHASGIVNGIVVAADGNDAHGFISPRVIRCRDNVAEEIP